MRKVEYSILINTIRKILKINQKEFAKLVGVSLFSIKKWEGGSCVPCQKNRIIINFIKKNIKYIKIK